MDTQSKQKRDWTKMGASYAAVFANDPSYIVTLIDVWYAMTGRKPLRDVSEFEPVYWGNALEDDIVDSFEDYHGLRRGTLVRDPHTNVDHPNYDWICATPDAFQIEKVEKGRHGINLECKNVGLQKMSAWTGSKPPEYVDCQVQWQLFNLNAALAIGTIGDGSVKHLDFGIIRALICGTECREFVVPYNKKRVSELFEVGEDFYKNYVLTDTPPPADASKAYQEHLKIVYPEAKNKYKKIADAEISKNIKTMCELQLDIEEMKLEYQLHKNIIASFIGDDYGVKSAWGTALNYNVGGKPKLKKVIEELKARYNIPQNEIDQLKEDYRGDATRIFILYPAKKLF